MSVPVLKVHPVPAFSDNYLWVVHDDVHAIAVDPGDAAPVIDFLVKSQLSLTAILCTHHHADHVGGIEALLDFFQLRGKIDVYGPANEAIPSRTIALREGDRVLIADMSVELSVLDVPGHTAGHIAYVGHGNLFCGDTLFACGCGRLFEGSAEQMQASLAKLGALPPETRVFCAHEYTMANIRFAEAVEPDNADLKLRKAFCAAKRHRQQPTLPSTIGLERATNPFLRWDAPAVKLAAGRRGVGDNPSPARIFGALRQWKDDFR